MKIQLLLTGNELMSGHTVDSNSAMVAELLSDHGYNITRKVTIGDDINTLIAEMEAISQHSDILIVNGGLGPTIDDLTAQALSELTGAELEENPIAKQQLLAWCERRNLSANASNLKQAILPKGVEIIHNPTGSAPGFCLTHNHCLIICTPGVPSELRLMMQQSIIDLLCQRYPTKDEVSTIRFQTFGVGESTLQHLVDKNFSDWPKAVELGFRAGMPQLEIKLTVRKKSDLGLQQEYYQRLKELIGDYIIGEDSLTLPESVINLLKQKEQQLTTAESCTGGLIAASITEIAGASNVFEAGFVTYSNSMKTSLLGVQENILVEHGAVSEAVVLAMAEGAMARSKADYAIAVSGIAGPEGGTEDKPVGTVWLAWGQRGALKTRRMQFNSPRSWFQQMVTATTLDLIRRELSGIEELPRYFKDKR